MPRNADAQHLTQRQHLGVRSLRALMGAAGASMKLRRKRTPASVVQHRYGAHPDERLEFIEPRPGSPARAPLVYIHGGGWIAGKKEFYTNDLGFLADEGYPIFNLEYPLAPEHPHPNILLSLLSALHWIRDRHPEYETMHLMGDSAGGNLAMMLAILTANPELIDDLEGSYAPRTPRPLSAISLYGVLDRLSWIEHRFPGSKVMLRSYGGDEAFEVEVGAELALTPMDLDFESLPPSFILAGSADQLAESSRLCGETLQKRHERVETKVYEGEGHGFFNRGGRPASQELRRDILDFLSRV